MYDLSGTHGRLVEDYEMMYQDEVIICEDEQEWERVVAEHKLKHAKILDNGNLFLRDGSGAGHR